MYYAAVTLQIDMYSIISYSIILYNQKKPQAVEFYWLGISVFVQSNLIL